MNKKASRNLLLAAISLALWMGVLFVGVNYLTSISKPVLGFFIVIWLLVTMYFVA